MPKARIIMLEGPDGAGKSTLADHFEKFEVKRGHGVMRIHNVPPRPGTSREALFDTYYNQMVIAAIRRPAHITTIIDRSFPSEVIYGPVFRDKSILTDKDVRKLERFARRHQVVQFGLDTDLDTRITRLLARDEDPDMQDYVGQAYDQYFRDHQSWIIVDSTSANN